MINKQKKKHDKMLSLSKYKLNSVEVLICKPSVCSNISQNEFVFRKNLII